MSVGLKFWWRRGGVMAFVFAAVFLGVLLGLIVRFGDVVRLSHHGVPVNTEIQSVHDRVWVDSRGQERRRQVVHHVYRTAQGVEEHVVWLPSARVWSSLRAGDVVEILHLPDSPSVHALDLSFDMVDFWLMSSLAGAFLALSMMSFWDTGRLLARARRAASTDPVEGRVVSLEPVARVFSKGPTSWQMTWVLPDGRQGQSRLSRRSTFEGVSVGMLVWCFEDTGTGTLFWDRDLV